MSTEPDYLRATSLDIDFVIDFIIVLSSSESADSLKVHTIHNCTLLFSYSFVKRKQANLFLNHRWYMKITTEIVSSAVVSIYLQVNQHTSGDLASREENHIHSVQMVFKKAVNKLRILASRNSTVSINLKSRQISTKSVSHPSNLQTRQRATEREEPNKQTKSAREWRGITIRWSC